MLGAAWQTLSQCCTRRQLHDTLRQRQYYQRTDCEQIDELAYLLRRLQQPCPAKNENNLDPVSKSCSTVGECSQPTKGSVVIVEQAPKASTAYSPVRGSGSDSWTPRESAEDAVFGRRKLTPEEHVPGNTSASRSSNVLQPGDFESPAGNIENALSPSFLPRGNLVVSISRDLQKGSPSCSALGLVDPITTCTSTALGGVTDIEPGESSFDCLSDDFSPATPSIPARLGDDNRNPQRHSAQYVMDDEPSSVSGGVHRQFSRFCAAVSWGFERARTHAFPALECLWHAEEQDRQRDTSELFGGFKKGLLAWDPKASLDSLCSSKWRIGKTGSQSMAPPAFEEQQPTQELHQHNASSSRVNTINARTAIVAKGSNATSRALRVVSPHEVDDHASLRSANSSDTGLNPASGGTFKSFCVLGATGGCEGSPSFRRRPMISRPSSMCVNNMKRLLGTASLTGDSLGRKSHWCSVLRSAVESGIKSAQQLPGKPKQQKHLEYVLLMQLLQQQQRMVLLPSSLNGTQQIGVCRSGNMWLGVVAQGIGFEAPAAANFVAGELLKELLGRCATSRTPLNVKRLDAETAEQYMLDSFHAVSTELQLQQAHVGANDGSPLIRFEPQQENYEARELLESALEARTDLQTQKWLMRQKHLNLSKRGGKKAMRDAGHKFQARGRSCGFDSTRSGAVACQFLWDAEQQLLLVCHTGDVKAILAHPVQERLTAERMVSEHAGKHDFTHFTAPAVAASRPFFKHQQPSPNFRGPNSSSGILSHSYDCIVLTREHSILDRDECRRLQGAGVFMTAFPASSATSCNEVALETSSAAQSSQYLTLNGSACDNSSEKPVEEGPSFFCPCLLTPPLSVTRALGLCGGQQFGIATTPDIATVTLENTFGLSFLIVATSSFWKVVSPREAVRLVVAELWQQESEHHGEKPRQRQRVTGSERASHHCVGPQTVTPQHAQQYARGHTEGGYSFDSLNTSRFGRRGSRQVITEQQERSASPSGSAETGSLLESDAPQVPTSEVRHLNLQMAADVLERRFCEEWQVQRESEPLADLGLIVLPLEPRYLIDYQNGTISESSVAGGAGVYQRNKVAKAESQ
ncbi:protein phosphatase 2c domain-containing protein [Cyclospora cayetanensis]|uniref:Protein phosphatase 2c domain-containing protein n=1 Tax=Cyclospora cayetanensis TaxID=88456 RepID=A0A1D3D2S8_9EIME|nr:protein phosphatase 2c domain-containing protein [Cyclospora cayetanensis]